MRVIGYTRVSTDEQGRSGLGLAAQRRSIEDHALAKGWEVTWMSDEGASAKSLARPALQRALGALKAGEAEAIVVAKLDRLSRSVMDFGHLVELSRKQQWGLVVLDFDLDTTTAAGRMFAGVMMQFAQFERELASERTVAALAAARERGVQLGRPRSLPATSEARLHELRAEGLTLVATAEALNAEGVPTAHGGRWHASTVARIAKRQPKPSTRTVRAA
ncbi:MAG: recombinase family protein [Microcella sp.]|uniref:recombinase family protein n=1 Tax=Microcella sp. TaxID=1913979 RepID=UPI00331453D3